MHVAKTNGIDCVCVCVGGTLKRTLGSGYGGQKAGPCEHGKGTSILTDTAPWRLSAGWHTLW